MKGECYNVNTVFYMYQQFTSHTFLSFVWRDFTAPEFWSQVFISLANASRSIVWTTQIIIVCEMQNVQGFRIYKMSLVSKLYKVSFSRYLFFYSKSLRIVNTLNLVRLLSNDNFPLEQMNYLCVSRLLSLVQFPLSANLYILLLSCIIFGINGKLLN